MVFKLKEQHKKVEGQLVVFFNMNHEKVCIYLKKKRGGGGRLRASAILSHSSLQS